MEEIPTNNSADSLQINQLPNELLTEIFKQLSNRASTNSILNCREVSMQWRNIIDNTNEIFKNITLQIDQRCFQLESQNIPRAIKSICFMLEPTNFNLANLPTKFTIECVTFTLKIGLISMEDSWKTIFSAVLCEFPALQELKVLCDFTGILKEMTPIDKELAASKIKKLTLNIRHSQKIKENLEAWTEFICSLSKLEVLSFVGNDCGTYFKSNLVMLLPTVRAHMYKYPGILKEFNIDGRYYSHYGAILPYSSASHDWVQLYLTAGKFNTKVNAGVLNLNDFLRFEPEDEEINQKNCKYITTMKFVIPEQVNEMSNLIQRLDNCKQLKKLLLDMYSGNIDKQLAIIDWLAADDVAAWITAPVITAIRNTQAAFTAKLANFQSKSKLEVIKVLQIAGNILIDPLDFLKAVANCFPSLQSVQLNRMEWIPADLIESLSELRALTSLELVSLPGLQDYHLTTLVQDPTTASEHCEQIADDSGEEFGRTCFANELPGRIATEKQEFEMIATDKEFKADEDLIPRICRLTTLRYLQISLCCNVTNNCLINGVCLHKTLQTIHLEKCIGFTAYGFNVLEQNCNLKCRLLNEIENERLYFRI